MGGSIATAGGALNNAKNSTAISAPMRRTRVTTPLDIRPAGSVLASPQQTGAGPLGA